ncbi:MAG: dTMP kinase [Candidatus Campbellbacteria bacterium]|nr:dTMP kinase [Candidatus Campbellbacteria bacterium]
MPGQVGKFIVIDGVEGAGKSTQIKKLKENLGEKAVVTREPGGSPYAEEIRELILNSEYAGQANAKVMFALFWAARADHLARTIIPALESGSLVISDRFDSTTFTHQIYGQEEKELTELFWTMRDYYLEDRAPETYIFLDVDPGLALERKVVNKSESNHFDEREIAFHERVREGTRAFAEQVPSRFVDASQPIDKVTESITEMINEYL